MSNLPECPRCAEQGKKIHMRAVIQGPPGQETTTKYECPDCGHAIAGKPEQK